MKIAVCSKSRTKLDAVKNALSVYKMPADIIEVATDSGVPAQPVEGETLQGAENRMRHGRKLVPDADYYIAIENGIFAEPDGRFVDKALIVVTDRKGRKKVLTSEGVELPAQWVKEAEKRGFATTTVGQVMAENGAVAKHFDPHLTLTGASRTMILAEALYPLLRHGWMRSPEMQHGPER